MQIAVADGLPPGTPVVVRLRELRPAYAGRECGCSGFSGWTGTRACIRLLPGKSVTVFLSLDEAISRHRRLYANKGKQHKTSGQFTGHGGRDAP